MKEIEQIIPLNIEEFKKEREDSYKKLRFAFKNPIVEKELMRIRGQFDIPHCGMKSFGFSSEDSLDEKKRKYKNFLVWMALLHDDKKLKELKLKRKSRKIKYQREITKLRKSLHLPIKFQEELAYSVVLRNRFSPTISSCDFPCLIQIFDDNEEKKLFIRVFGDTTIKDIIKAWPYIEKSKKEHSIVGSFLSSKYDNYYLGKLVDDLHKKGEKDVRIAYMLKELTGKEHDEDYVKVLRQKYRKFTEP